VAPILDNRRITIAPADHQYATATDLLAAARFDSDTPS
jgi:hypothetical protein